MDRQPSLPYALDAEETVCGAVLFSGRSLDRVAHMLTPDDFYHPATQAIFQSCVDLDQRSSPIDILTVRDAMVAAGSIQKLSGKGGGVYLADLSARIATIEHIEHHAEIVRDKAQRRRIILAFGSLRDKAQSEQQDVAAALDEAERELSAVTAPDRRMRRMHLDDWCAEESQDLARMRRERRSPGASTGFWALDDLVVGWQPGELEIVAARPSMGKTAFVLSSAVRGGAGGVPHLLLSAEMRGGALAQRAISSEAAVPLGLMRRRGLGYREEPAIRDMLERWRSPGRRLPVQIAECRAPLLSEVRREVRRWHREIGGGHAVAWLDYLQLVRPPAPRGRRDQGRERDVAEISAGLKELALELGISVVALSQLNRGVEERDDKRPMLSDLRDSGAIEQDADLVLCLYREEHYKPKTDSKGVAEVIVRKQRNGALGTARLKYDAPYTRFTDLEPRPATAPGAEQEELL